jgi:hypothetical protein
VRLAAQAVLGVRFFDFLFNFCSSSVRLSQQNPLLKHCANPVQVLTINKAVYRPTWDHRHIPFTLFPLLNLYPGSYPQLQLFVFDV